MKNFNFDAFKNVVLQLLKFLCHSKYRKFVYFMCNYVYNYGDRDLNKNFE